MSWKVAYWYLCYRITEVFGYGFGADIVAEMMLGADPVVSCRA